MAKIADIVARAAATVGHIIRVIREGGASQQANRQYLDFAGNCTVEDTGDAIRVTIPAVPSGSVTVGRTVTLPPGELAYVHNLGTKEHAVLEFGIPLSRVSLDTALEIWQGGTGATSAEEARQKLSVPSLVQFNAVKNTADANKESIDSHTTALSTITGDVAELKESVAARALDSAVVKLAGEQTISGAKVFSVSPIVPTPLDTDDSSKAATTAWVRRYIDAKLEEIFYYARGAAR